MKRLLLLATTVIAVSLAMTLPASAQYEPMHITVSPTAVTSCGSDTGQITVDAGFFKTGATVTVTLQSDPVVLGTATADAAGNIHVTYNLPVGVAAGSHTVTATGIRKSTGLSESISAAITVTIPTGCVSNVTAVPTTVVTGTSGTGSLPVTGSDNGTYIAVGAGLLVAGGLLVMATRKRSAARS